MTKSGPLDLLGIDKAGNTIVVEIKRDELPRECLAQAIDYASDVADWTVEHLSEVCSEFAKKTFEDVFNDAFPDVDLENVNLNSAQRIVLVGFSIESSLERMIEWLSGTDAVNVNAIVLSYVKTRNGDELLTKTSIISEEMEEDRRQKQKKFAIPMSNEPGAYDVQRLKQLLLDYLARDKVTNRRMRDIFLPACLKKKVLTPSTRSIPSLRRTVMIDLHPSILERDGKKAFVVLPYEEFLMLEEEMQSFEDLKALRAAKAEEADTSTVPLFQAREDLGL